MNAPFPPPSPPAPVPVPQTLIPVGSTHCRYPASSSRLRGVKVPAMLSNADITEKVTGIGWLTWNDSSSCNYKRVFSLNFPLRRRETNSFASL